MTGRYEMSELQTYGAEDDADMDAILDALERANSQASDSGPQAPRAGH